MKLFGLLIASAFLIGGCAAPQAAKKSTSGKTRTESHGYRIKTAQGACLRYDAAKNALSTAECGQENTQRFAVAGNGIRVQGLCVQAGAAKARNGTVSVTAARCTGGLRQHWYRDGQAIRSSANGLCLDNAKGNTVYLSRCNASRTQQFTFSH